MLTCIIGAMDQCPKTAVYMEEILEKMSAKSNEQGGPDMPTYAESRKYILESCPKLPEGGLVLHEDKIKHCTRSQDAEIEKGPIFRV